MPSDLQYDFSGVLKAVKANPFDRETRLVLSDLYRERGDDEGAKEQEGLAHFLSKDVTLSARIVNALQELYDVTMRLYRPYASATVFAWVWASLPRHRQCVGAVLKAARRHLRGGLPAAYVCSDKHDWRYVFLAVVRQSDGRVCMEAGRRAVHVVGPDTCEAPGYVWGQVHPFRSFGAPPEQRIMRASLEAWAADR